MTILPFGDHLSDDLMVIYMIDIEPNVSVEAKSSISPNLDTMFQPRIVQVNLMVVWPRILQVQTEIVSNLNEI